MGAGAGKQFQSDKTKHAEIILEAVQSYERAHPGEIPSDNFSFQSHLFKRRVLLAAAESKRRGKDIDSSLNQLTDADLETLFHYIESNRNNKLKTKDVTIPDPDQSSNSSTMNSVAVSPNVSGPVQISTIKDILETTTKGLEVLAKTNVSENQVMTVEEFVEEDFNGGDNIDETTSVLSYGDDDRENDSEAEVESSGSLLIHRPSSKKAQNRLDSSGEIVEDLEVLDESHRHISFDSGKNDPMRNSGAKIFPSVDTDATLVPKEQRIAQTLAKFWEIDDIGSVGSQLELGSDSTLPFSPYVAKSDKNASSSRVGSAYKDRGQKIDERNERLMGLQRQKVMSYTQNAQLEREVEALQKQLERMEELERSMELSPSGAKLNNSMASSASTFQGSAEKNPHNSVKGQENIKKLSNRYSYIYPIDEEANEWPGSGKDHKRIVPESKRLSDNSSHPQDQILDRVPTYRGSKPTSYSSSDSEDDLISQSTGAIDRLLSDDKISNKISIEHKQGKSDYKECNLPLSQSKVVKHVAKQRRRANVANASSGVDSDDSATSNYSGTNSNARRIKNVAVSGNASDSDNGLQPLSARVKGSSNIGVGNSGPKRQISEKDKRALAQIPAPSSNMNPANNALPNGVLNGQSNNSPKKSISDARRARNTIGTEENKPRLQKPPGAEGQSETEEVIKAAEEHIGEPKKQFSSKKLNKRYLFFILSFMSSLSSVAGLIGGIPLME